MGPEALRVAGIVKALERLDVAVHDCGNLQGPMNPDTAARDGYRHFDEVLQWNRLLHQATYDQLSDGRVPVMLGGDHCLGMGSVSAVARFCRQQKRTLRVLWLDAHTDFNTSRISPSGNIHGMPAACLCGYGPDALTGLGGYSPALAPSEIRQIGIRSVDTQEKRLVRDADIQVYDMRAIDEQGMRQVMQHALRDVAGDVHLHVSFDVDFLDPDIAPGVGTTVRGGPTYREAQLCMEMIADTGCLASLDIVELNPALDVHNQTAMVAVDLVQSLFGKRTLMRG
jgi:arginase